MSDSSGGEKILSQPLKNIGAQDIQRLGVYTSGFLRKKGEVERMISGLPGTLGSRVSHFLKWRQKYVAISQGCLYCFDDEYSKSPHTAYSLQNYKKVDRTEDTTDQMKYCFNIIPEDLQTKVLHFSSNCDKSRLDWMRAVYQNIKLAKHEPPEDADKLSNAGYEFFEGQVMPVPGQTPSCRPKRSQRPLPQVPSDTAAGAGKTSPAQDDEYELSPERSDSDASDDSKDYQQIDDDLLEACPADTAKDTHLRQSYSQLRTDDGIAAKTGRYLPIEKNGKPNYMNEVQEKARKAILVPTPFVNQTKPIVAPKPKRQFSKEEYDYSGSDPSDATTLLHTKPEGTFLIRKSRQEGQKVLCVRTEEGVKQFKLYARPDGHMSIDNEAYFKDTEAMLDYYSKSSLPKNTAKLKRGYSQSNILS